MAQVKNGHVKISIELKGTDKEILKQANLIVKKLNSKFDCNGKIVTCYSRAFGSIDEHKKLLGDD